MIQLSNFEKKLVKFCKGHLQEEYKTNAKSWPESLKPLFKETYQIDPDEDQQWFLGCAFNVLFQTYMKIRLDGSGRDIDIQNLLIASFEKTMFREYNSPVERVIAELCGQIQGTLYLLDGEPRFDLD